MAKNYDALGDAYQANYILENIIKNFGSYPDIVAEAKAEQRVVKQKESRSNSSINLTVIKNKNTLCKSISI